MPRPLRNAPGGVIYHVLNRANGKLRIFKDDADYAIFEKVLADAVERTGMRLLAWCMMPNHWHLILWPRKDGDLSEFMRWITVTHTQRWHAHRRDSGRGHLYQGRFRSFPVEQNENLLVVARYIEANPRRAKLVKRAEKWKWSSLAVWARESADDKSLVSVWPVRRKTEWVRYVNEPQTPAEEQAVLTSIVRSRPFGEPAWQLRMADRLGLKMTLVPRGRPRKVPVRTKPATKGGTTKNDGVRKSKMPKNNR